MTKLWLQVTLEDTVAEFFYAPLALMLIAWGVAFFGLVDFPHAVFAASAVLLLSLFVLRAIRNWIFIRESDLAIAKVGVCTGKFRKWREHVLDFSVDGTTHRVRHVFLKNEVEPGDDIAILSRRGKRESILVAHRSRDAQSLLQ